MNRHDEIRARASTFHSKHPEVWDLFERFALEKIRDGHKHYGAKAVMERVRWESDKGGTAPDFKINNNFISLYARRFVQRHPKHAEFFRTRVQLSKFQVPRGTEG